MNFEGKSFLKLLDFTPEEISALIDLAANLKAKKKAGELVDVLKGKNIAIIFEKTSTQQEFWAVCLTVLNIGDLNRLL